MVRGRGILEFFGICTEKRQIFSTRIRGSGILDFFGICTEKRKKFSTRVRGSEIFEFFGICTEKRKFFSTRVRGSGILEFFGICTEKRKIYSTRVRSSEVGVCVCCCVVLCSGYCLSRVATGQWKKIQPKTINFGGCFPAFFHSFFQKSDGFPAFPASIRTGKQTLVLGMQEEPKNGG